MTKQKFSSANTSINKNHYPAIYNKINWNKIFGLTVVDYGCGQYIEHLIKKANYYGCNWLGCDLTWRSTQQNEEAVYYIKKHSVVLCSNLLNVIKEDSIIQNIVNLITSSTELFFFTIYDGNKTGIGRQTSSDSWQRNQKLKDIYNQFFINVPNAVIYKGTICNKLYKNVLCK